MKNVQFEESITKEQIQEANFNEFCYVMQRLVSKYMSPENEVEEHEENMAA